MSIGEHILYRSAHFGALFYLVLFGEFAKLVVDETGKPQRDRSAHVLSVGIQLDPRSGRSGCQIGHPLSWA